jgi:hypothetical protein
MYAPILGQTLLPSSTNIIPVLTYGAIRSLVAPIEVCVNVDPLKPDYFSWPFYDVTFFHAALLTTSATNDYVLSRNLSKTTVFHLRRTLYFLNEKLAQENAWLEDSTVYVIIMLTLMAVSFGDYAAAGAHMDGLRRIVELRGGIEYLESTPKLHYKLDRYVASFFPCPFLGPKPDTDTDTDIHTDIHTDTDTDTDVQIVASISHGVSVSEVCRASPTQEYPGLRPSLILPTTAAFKTL